MAKSSNIRIICDNLYPTVEAHLSKKSNVDRLNRDIAKYFDNHSDEIYDTGLSKKILFLDSDKNVIYDAANLSKEKIKLTLKQSSYIKDTWKILNEPLNTAALLVLRYFAINDKKGDQLKVFLTFYSFYFYASLYHKYLPYGANENVMSYTINNLSNKFKIKQLGSLFATVQHIVMTSHETYKEKLINGEDGDLAVYVSSLKVRLNDFVKNIKNEYTINYKENKFMNYDSDSYEEDNFHIADNTSYAIKRISEASLMRLMTYGPNIQFADLAAEMSSVSRNEIRNVVDHLSDDDDKDILRISELILHLYLSDNNRVEDIKGNKFFVACMDLYKKSNTNDKLILEMKAILDKWLNKYSPSYRKTHRDATLSNFRRAIFVYFVFHIRESAR